MDQHHSEFAFDKLFHVLQIDWKCLYHTQAALGIMNEGNTVTTVIIICKNLQRIVLVFTTWYKAWLLQTVVVADFSNIK